MKYLTVSLDQLPLGFKNGEICPIVHFHIENEAAFCENDPFREEYLDFITKEIAERFYNQLILYRPGVIGTRNHRIHVVFKDNCDLRQIKERANHYCRELNFFTSHKLKVYYGVGMIMLLQKDKQPGILKSNKMGEDYLSSEVYQNEVYGDNGPIDERALSTLTPLREFRLMKKAELAKADDTVK